MDSVLGLTLTRLLLTLALLASQSAAMASEVAYWYPGNSYTLRFGSAASACQSKATGTLIFDHATAGDGATGECYYTNSAVPAQAAQSQYGWTRDSYTVVDPPSCAIGVQEPNPVSWVIGYRTGPSVNSPVAGTVSTPAQIAAQEFCSGLCAIVADRSPGAAGPSIQLQAAATPGGYYPIVATDKFVSNGGQCGGRPTPASHAADAIPPSVAAEKDKCPAGTTSGGIDSSGTPICLGTATAPTAGKSETSTTNTTNGQGQPVKTTITNTTNADGSITTSRTDVATNADGSTTTTTAGTTGATPSGAPGRSDSGKADPTKPEDKSDLCKLHPELNVCKNSLVSGLCQQTACEGDAIQCAILRVAATEQCDKLRDNDLSKAAQAVAGNNMTGLPTTGNATQVDLGSVGAQLDSSGFLGGGSCFPDRTINILGRTVVMKLSAACPVLENMKYAIMLVALLTAYKIVGGTILKEV